MICLIRRMKYHITIDKTIKLPTEDGKQDIIDDFESSWEESTTSWMLEYGENIAAVIIRRI